MSIRIAIIDGTGVDDQAQYKKEMAKSFCRTLANQLATSANYQRGPGTAGLQVLGEATRAAEWLRAEHQKDAKAHLMLAGYSRGGSAAIMAAERLESQGVAIHSMFLFDPVARHLYDGGETIPGNVQFSRTCRRDQSWTFVMKYEGTLNTNETLGNTSNPTRPFFGNTGLTWRGTGDHRPPKVFTGSHGAMGGVGWAFVTEDRECQLKVSSWMGMQMRMRGLNVALGPGSLNTTPPVSASRTTRTLGQALDAALIGRSAVERSLGGQSAN